MSIGRDAALVTSANVLAQVLQLLALPAISAYAAPAAFGEFTLFAGLCAVVSVFAGLRYDPAIIVATSAGMARVVARLVWSLGLAAAIACLLLVPPALVASIASSWGRAATLGALAAAYTLANTSVRVAVNWLTREGQFSWVGAVQFTAVVATVAAQLLLLHLGLDAATSLMLGLVGGQAIATALAFGIAGRGRRWLARFDLRRLRAAARVFVRFPQFMIVYGLNSTLRERAVHLLIGWGAGAGALGQMAMAQRLASAPHGFCHSGIGPALMAHARSESRPEVGRTAAALMELAALVLAPPFIFLAFNARALIDGFLNPAWSGLAVYIQWLAVPYALVACTGFADRLFEFYGQQKEALHMDLGLSVMLLGALGLAALSADGAVMTATFGIVLALFELFWTWRVFAANGLPLAPLWRMARVTLVQMLAFAALNGALMAIDSLVLRAAVAALAMLSMLAAHFRWLGGRRLLSRLLTRKAVTSS